MMIEDSQFEDILSKLNIEYNIEEIFKERLSIRLKDLNTKLMKNEDLKFKYLIENYMKNKDLSSLLQYLNYIPNEVDSNKNFLVSYLYSNLMKSGGK